MFCNDGTRQWCDQTIVGFRDADEFRDILMINTLGPYLVIKEVLPLIRRGTKKQVRSIFGYLLDGCS